MMSRNLLVNIPTCNAIFIDPHTSWYLYQLINQFDENYPTLTSITYNSMTALWTAGTVIVSNTQYGEYPGVFMSITHVCVTCSKCKITRKTCNKMLTTTIGGIERILFWRCLKFEAGFSIPPIVVVVMYLYTNASVDQRFTILTIH